MKKIIYLTILALIFACGGNDSNDINSIEGRWNFISQTDCGDPQVTDSCSLQSYMTLDNGLGEITVFNLIDEVPGTCQISDIIDVTYSVVPNNPNTYNFIGANSSGALATLNGNTLTLTEEYDAGDSNCPQQDVVIEVLTFTRD